MGGMREWLREEDGSGWRFRLVGRGGVWFVRDGEGCGECV